MKNKLAHLKLYKTRNYYFCCFLCPDPKKYLHKFKGYLIEI